MSTLEEERALLAGLHFAKEALSEMELKTLYVAESVLARIDAVEELHYRTTPFGEAASCGECDEFYPCTTIRTLKDPK